MRIGVDIRGLLTGKWSGVEQYTAKLLEHILQLDQHNTYVLFYVSYRDLPAKFDELMSRAPWLKRDNVEVKTLKWINFPLLLHALWKPLLWPKIDKICGGLDWLWLPSPRLAPVSSRCKVLITFHDLIQELFPGFYAWQSNLWHWQMSFAYLARWANKLVAVSQNTKNDLVRLYDLDPGKITVIYEGVDEAYFRALPPAEKERIKKKFKIDSDFIYYVGSLEPRKNLIGAVRSLNYLRSVKPDQFGKIRLVISGGKSWLAGPLFAEIKKLHLERQVIITGPVSEEDKIALLSTAKLFIFPSWYEGFGLPVLEAMAAGCPVVTSNRSSLPEVADEAAILVDPARQDELNCAVEKILASSSLAQSLATRGKLQARKFRWAKAAEETLHLFTHHGG